jgi:hypothetical protein
MGCVGVFMELPQPVQKLSVSLTGLPHSVQNMIDYSVW